MKFLIDTDLKIIQIRTYNQDDTPATNLLRNIISLRFYNYSIYQDCEQCIPQGLPPERVDNFVFKCINCGEIRTQCCDEKLFDCPKRFGD